MQHARPTHRQNYNTANWYDQAELLYLLQQQTSHKMEPIMKMQFFLQNIFSCQLGYINTDKLYYNYFIHGTNAVIII